MSKVKGIHTDDVLRRLRLGERCCQRILKGIKRPFAFWSSEMLWHFPDGTAVTCLAVSTLRKRGQIAIAEESSFRVLKPINKECCCAGTDSQRG